MALPVSVGKLLFAGALNAVVIAFGSTVSAQAVEVIDGDTLRINKVRVRIFGIDAPENGQTCSAAGRSYDCSGAATRALARLVEGRSVSCKAKGRDRYRRIIAVCYADGLDVGREMVRQGWALAFRRYSLDYVRDELEAQRERRGIWVGIFTPPWDYRR